MGLEACHFIDQYGEEGPFAMMVGFPGPHCPYDPAPEFLDDIDPSAMPEAAPEVAGDAPKLRQGNVEGNKRPWNGVDYGEFTDAQKRKIRTHYAASVAQIDYEVGQILESLERKGLLKNTVIIFSADHGDYLGDHNLIGKSSFFQGSIHVPMIVSVPWADGAKSRSDLVTLTDVTATILRLAGCDVPAHFDSVPLPNLGLAEETPHDHIICMTNGGWMIDALIEGNEWRLSKYSTGECLLFNVMEDPQEQHNRYIDPAYADVRECLDVRLTQAVMHGIREANHDRRVYVRDLSQRTWFGREGWQRPYPRQIDDR